MGAISLKRALGLITEKRYANATLTLRSRYAHSYAHVYQDYAWQDERIRSFVAPRRWMFQAARLRRGRGAERGVWAAQHMGGGDRVFAGVKSPLDPLPVVAEELQVVGGFPCRRLRQPSKALRGRRHLG